MTSVKTQLVALLLLTVSAFAAELNSELDAIAASAYAADEPGAAIIVIKNGETLLEKGYGMADLELGIAIEPDMVFRIGSVTKQFTAAAILLLDERSELSVQDDIRKHLPDYPTEGRTITIEHLLTHTSGIRSYTDMESFGEHMRDDLSIDELIDTFKNEPLAFGPGEKYAYNNSGYVLLGAIVEKVSGESYQAFLQKNIFEPLEMTQSYYGAATPVIERRARGYSESAKGFVNASYLSMKLPYAAGSLLSTVGDLAKWDAALYTDDLLSQASRDKWWKPFHLKNGASTYYAYGWGISAYEGHPVVAHGGGINGFTCYVLRMPEDRVYVAVLTNRNARSSPPSLVARRLAAAAVGKPLAEPETVDVSEDVLERYVGLYRVDENASHVVSLEDGYLYLRRYGDEHPEGGRVRNPGPSERLNRVRAELWPSSESTFFLKDSPLSVRFEDDALVVEGGGREERALKLDLPIDDRSVILRTVQKLFDGMTALDTDAMRSVLDPEARLVHTFTRDGVPGMRAVSMKDFLSNIASHTRPTLVERSYDAEVRVEDNLATVWLAYDFFVGDELDHCGEDTFQLARTNLGWKIIAIADTRRDEGCERR